MEKENYLNNTTSLKDYISKTMLYMSIGLILSMTLAILTSQYLDYFRFRYHSFVTGITFVLLGLEILVVFYLEKRIYEMSKLKALIFFGIYSILNGFNLTWIFLGYSEESVVITFGLCALLFLSMSLIGYTTKINLLKYSSLIKIGLIALLIGSIINIFVFNNFLSWVMSSAGIVLFLLLVAYDLQKLRNLYNECYGNPELYSKLSIIGALALYIDFINIFVRILSLFGSRKE